MSSAKELWTTRTAEEISIYQFTSLASTWSFWLNFVKIVFGQSRSYFWPQEYIPTRDDVSWTRIEDLWVQLELDVSDASSWDGELMVLWSGGGRLQLGGSNWLPPDEEELSLPIETREWVLLLAHRECSKDETAIELRNRGIAAVQQQ